VKAILTLLWQRWKAIGHRIATVQSRVLLFVFYYLVLAPFAIGLKLWSDPLGLRPATAPGWKERSPAQGDALTLARKQS